MGRDDATRRRYQANHETANRESSDKIPNDIEAGLSEDDDNMKDSRKQMPLCCSLVARCVPPLKAPMERYGAVMCASSRSVTANACLSACARTHCFFVVHRLWQQVLLRKNNAGPSVQTTIDTDVESPLSGTQVIVPRAKRIIDFCKLRANVDHEKSVFSDILFQGEVDMAICDENPFVSQTVSESDSEIIFSISIPQHKKHFPNKIPPERIHSMKGRLTPNRSKSSNFGTPNSSTGRLVGSRISGTPTSSTSAEKRSESPACASGQRATSNNYDLSIDRLLETVPPPWSPMRPARRRGSMISVTSPPTKSPQKRPMCTTSPAKGISSSSLEQSMSTAKMEEVSSPRVEDHHRHSVAAEDEQEPDQRPRRPRVSRRQSFVAGSKIEHFDVGRREETADVVVPSSDNIHEQEKRQSQQPRKENANYEEDVDQNKSRRRRFGRRSSFVAGSKIEHFEGGRRECVEPWKMDLMQDG